MIADNNKDNYAVLTGDIVKSAKLDSVNLKIVLQSLNEGQEKFGTIYPGSMVGTMDVFSGDSWQVLMGQRHLSLRAVLYFRALVKAVKGLNADTRIALAWGQIDEETLNPESISKSTGEAFTLSGRALTEMDKSKFLTMKVSENLNQSQDNDFPLLPPTFLLLDEISSRWTEKQADSMVLALLGSNQYQIALEHNIAQPSVNKSLNAAGWRKIREYLELIEDSLKRL